MNGKHLREMYFEKKYMEYVCVCAFVIGCNCNGRSQECYFDPELYRSTGHGGHCTGCFGNTAGPNCERCRENFYRIGSEEGCQPCNCNPVGK